MTLADLHVHTTASDGAYAPAEVVRMAHTLGITHLAITDHDTMGGLAAARDTAASLGITLLNGVEISAGGDSEVHVLGYGVQESCEELKTLFARMHDERIERARRMARRLHRLGMPVDIESILQNAKGSVGRPHLARALLAKGFVQSVQEAFEKYIGEGCPAYVPREELAVTEVIALLRRSHAVPVLAHPLLLHWPQEQLLPCLTAWQRAGLMGLEVYHPCQAQEYEKWLTLAKERSLMVTGGSDFHDNDPRHGGLGETATAWKNSTQDITFLLNAMQNA